MADSPPFVPLDTPIREELFGSAREILARLEFLRAQDKATEAKRALLKKLLWVLAILGFVGCLFVFGIFLFIPFGIVYYFYKRAGRKDLEDRKLEIVSRLVEVLQDELSASENVQVMIDFNGYAKGAQPRGLARFAEFTHEWLKIDLPIADGGRLKLVATTHCKRKMKYKRKYVRNTDRLQEELRLQITPAKGTVLEGQKAPALARMLGSLSGLQCRSVKLRPKSAAIELRTERAVFRDRPKYGKEQFAGWENLLDSERVLRLVVLSYRGLSGASRVRS